MADRTDSGGEGTAPLGPVDAVRRLWEGQTGLAGRFLGAILTPAELGYRAVMGARNAAYGAGVAPTDVPPLPAISIGNITVGGTGKTPMVRWVVTQLQRRGWTPGILHGGYAEDEPALHRRWFPDLPVVADRDRLRGAGRAMELGADVLVLDDAFQHRRFGRDLDIVLIAAEAWGRSARLLPRGPYREPPSALRRADIVVVTRRTAPPERAAEVEVAVARASRRPTARVFVDARRWVRPDGSPRQGPPSGAAIGIAGIARPDDFFDQAEAVGARLEDAIAFPDHHPYSAAEAAAILRLAAGGPIVTTAKDAVKLAPMMELADFWILEQKITFESGREWVLGAVEEVVS
ncbi:MAG TPA: tetraacyldisaccharide 4'-kinase [Longimicrobiales bacterium]|nr:tetraacyldisaccharide 4'-kinase [Longimicrobiales bacterium]